jgi:hypothetical protein
LLTELPEEAMVCALAVRRVALDQLATSALMSRDGEGADGSGSGEEERSEGHHDEVRLR